MTSGPVGAERSGARSLLRLFGLARPLIGRMLIAAGAGALATGCGVALLALSGFLLARASAHPNIVALSVAVVAVRALSVGRGVFRYGERLASHDVAFRVLARVRVAIWRRLESLAPAGLPQFHSGDLLTRLVGDVDGVQDLFIRGTTPVIAALVVGCGAVLACVGLVGPAGLLLAAGLLTGAAAVPVTCLAFARIAAQRTAPARGRLGSAVVDVLAGAPDVIAFGAQDVALGRAESANRELSAHSRRAAAASGLSAGLCVLVAGLTVWGVLLLGVAAVGDGPAGRVPLAAATLTALASFEAVGVLPGAAIALSQASAGARRVSSVLDAPDPVSEPARPLYWPGGTTPLTPPARWPGGPIALRLREVRVRYQPDGPFALDGVSLDLTPGRRVALIGTNGAGKSTVAAVLLRFLDLASGSVSLESAELPTDRAPGQRSDLEDSHELSEYSTDDVRMLIGGYPQDPHLFNASIGDNLRIALPADVTGQADDERLAAVLDQVGLTSWIASLPAGLDSRVGQDGTAVSGGQRQRIALARALLADPQVLILDEPTAHLDPATRRMLMSDLLTATAGRSTLLITHDLDGLDQVDEIVVLDHGRVVERGTHAGLLAAGGHYAQMWRRTVVSALSGLP